LSFGEWEERKHLFRGMSHFLKWGGGGRKPNPKDEEMPFVNLIRRDEKKGATPLEM